MYTAVFKRVWIESDGDFIDISEQIGNIKYVRDTEKDDEVVFTIEQPYISNLSNNVIRRGQTIRFQYGLKGGEKSPVHKARIVDIGRKYARTISMTVKARDLGTIMKASTSVKIWNDKTLSEICKEIASRYKLEFVGDVTTQKYNNYPQSQKDDLSFLRELAMRESDGNYEVFVTDNRLTLERRGMNKRSELTFEYGRDERVISFSVKNKESTNKASKANRSAFVGFDPVEGKMIGEATTNENEANNVNLGEIEFTLSASGELIENEVNIGGGDADFKALGAALIGLSDDTKETIDEIYGGSGIPKFGESVVTPYESPAEIKSLSNSTKKKSSLKTTTAELKVIGQPNMKLNSVITMAGVEKVDLGNYLIRTITDVVASSGFTTSMGLEKNAGKKRNKVTDTTNVEKANTTTGAKSTSSTTSLPVFNENGQLVENSTSAYKPPK